ncbi:uncharacterized protein LOC143026480 [Oratosquilla oratoria]|uniref:uncharacterized protein LOC143026480 n=1 Tax=Oratosquilla oratoria TaxID=337810 RepID=UPI003F777B7E
MDGVLGRFRMSAGVNENPFPPSAPPLEILDHDHRRKKKNRNRSLFQLIEELTRTRSCDERNEGLRRPWEAPPMRLESPRTSKFDNGKPSRNTSGSVNIRRSLLAYPTTLTAVDPPTLLPRAVATPGVGREPRQCLGPEKEIECQNVNTPTASEVLRPEANFLLASTEIRDSPTDDEHVVVVLGGHKTNSTRSASHRHVQPEGEDNFDSFAWKGGNSSHDSYQATNIGSRRPNLIALPSSENVTRYMTFSLSGKKTFLRP